MNNKRNLLAIIAFLLIFLCVSFYVGCALNSAPAFAVCVATLLPLVAIYCVGVLDYKVGGSQLSLEPRVHNLEEQTAELQKVSTALLKALYLVADGAPRMGGVPNKHNDLLNDYLKDIAHLVDSDVRNKVEADIRSID
ncbi:MAG TPA: hypothetical protein PKD57_15100 [Saprospiraceae bacterium]|nr:hypothetical protein [Saprospiraceae bacterium]HNG59640.1 hypothetical protein [Cellvibrionaceae bacterium]